MKIFPSISIENQRFFSLYTTTCRKATLTTTAKTPNENYFRLETKANNPMQKMSSIICEKKNPMIKFEKLFTTLINIIIAYTTTMVQGIVSMKLSTKKVLIVI